jgi:predicted RNA-binding Zn-ribbon protein involved in translation (DUF1610 family)
MLNNDTSQQLLVKIPFLLKKLDKKDINMLAWKWGMEDEIFHSAKATVIRLKLDIKEDEVRKIENNAVNIIEKEMDKVFTCPNCGTDIRKCGLNKQVTGHQVSEVFISANGVPTRVNNPRFQQQSYHSVPYIRHTCLSCGRDLKSGDAITLFLTNPICRDIILSYMMRFKEVVQEDIEGININTRHNEYLPEYPLDSIEQDD